MDKKFKFGIREGDVAIYPPTRVLLLSGGLDSTYALWHYLTKTNYKLHVHHVCIRNSVYNRWKCEDKAVKGIIDYCKKHYREFDYSESRFDFFGFKDVSWDADIHILAGTKVARNIYGSVILATGVIKNDLDTPQHYAGKVVEACSDPLDCISNEIEHPIIDKTKREIYEEIPDDLFKLTFSCRVPQNGKPCGKCIACKQRSNSGIPL